MYMKLVIELSTENKTLKLGIETATKIRYQETLLKALHKNYGIELGLKLVIEF